MADSLQEIDAVEDGVTRGKWLQFYRRWSGQFCTGSVASRRTFGSVKRGEEGGCSLASFSYNRICVHNVVAVATIAGVMGVDGKMIRINLLPCAVFAGLAGILG